MNNFLTILLIGRSGCGKGTQAELLVDFFKKRGEQVIYIYTGEHLRELSEQNNLTGKFIAERIMKQGGLTPTAFAVYSWTKDLIEKFQGKTHLIFDGSPRTKNEAVIMDEIFEFYGLRDVYPVLIDVSREEAFKRLKARARFDDTDESINHRLDYFEKDVAPAIDYYKGESKNKLRVVDGNPRDIDKIHSDVLKILNPK